MIQIIFDFNNSIATYTEGKTTVVRRLEINEISKWIQTASMGFSTNDGRRITACWKVWNNLEQFVTLDEFDNEGWYTIARWSYIDKPQPGTSQTSEVVGSHDGYSVMVVGSKYGDWMTI